MNGLIADTRSLRQREREMDRERERDRRIDGQTEECLHKTLFFFASYG
jgi:hypothetical protein